MRWDARCLLLISNQCGEKTLVSHMDLDKVLLLLSLREEDANLGDAMDIDGGSGYVGTQAFQNGIADEVSMDHATADLPSEINKTGNFDHFDDLNHDITDNREGEVQERLLVVSLLSPTLLGAQYAINKRNDRASRAFDDHNTSSDSILRENHKSTFSTASSSDLYCKPSYTVQEPDMEPSALHQNNNEFHGNGNGSQIGNDFNGMFRRQFLPYPIQVHHHHYYTPSNPGSSSSSLAVSEPENHLRQRQMHLATNDQFSSKSLEQAPQRPLVPYHDLPLPWDSRATPAEEHAYMLSSYLQLAVNSVVSAYAIHLVWTIVAAIRKDVSHKLSRHANNLLVEIALCERSYRMNNCQPGEIVPALEKMCAYWEQCMLQDPERGGNVSSLGAQTIGMVITSLIEPLSFKALSVFACVVFLVYVYNFAFGYVRARTYYGA